MTLHKWHYQNPLQLFSESVLFLLLPVNFFHSSLPRKFTTFFSLFSCVKWNFFIPISLRRPICLFFLFFFLFFKIPHNKNVSLILILLLRQSKPSLLGMSYKSQKSSDSLKQRFYLKHLLCGQSRLKTDQIALRAVLGWLRVRVVTTWQINHIQLL